MQKDDEEYLSAEDLRNRLYHSLRDRGLVNTMKSQLRTNLVSELKQSMKGKLTVADLDVPESGSLLHRASNSLVADHLHGCKYDYTYSVFLPECGIERSKLMSHHDLLQLLKISPQSRLYRKMTADHPEKSRKGFLWQLLSELCALHSQSNHAASTQTDLIKVATVSTLDEKMHVVEELFSSKREEQYRTGATALEDRLLSFQKQLEERFRTELKLQVAKVKDEESSRIRLEERESARKEIDQTRRELERQYQAKFDGLVQRERNATERIQRETEIQEREVYNQRQSILQEIETVHQREAQVKREAEVIQREKKLETERLKASEQDLRRRQLELTQKETEFDQRLHNEMTKFKVEYQAKFMERTQNVEVREATLRGGNSGRLVDDPVRLSKRSAGAAGVSYSGDVDFGVKPHHKHRTENEKRVADDQSKIDGLKDEVRDKTARVNELETSLQELRHKEVASSRHNEFLNAKLRDMSDYASIKEQNITYRNELENLKTRMAEIMQLNERERIRQEEMLQELRRPTTIAGYESRRPTRDDMRQDRAVHDYGRLQGDRSYHEDDRNRLLIRQFEEQTLQMKEMNQELTDVKQTLSQTQQALTNEVYRKPKDETSRLVSFNVSHRSGTRGGVSGDDSDIDISSGSSRRRKSKNRGRSYETKDVYNDVDVDDLSAPRISTDFTDEESSNQSASIIAETKYRLKSLEKEAKNLEKAYVDFHYQLTNPSSVPDPVSHSLRNSRSTHSDKAGKSGHPVASPTASPITRPMSSTPYQQGYSRDDSSDSLQELKGSSSHGKERVSTEPVPKFSLSDMSDDDIETSRKEERIEKPRPITVDDLEARPGSPSIMVVQGDRSNEDSRQRGSGSKAVADQEEKTESRLPSRLPPLSLDAAWKSGGLDSSWKAQTEPEPEKPAVEQKSAEDWEEERRRREEERRRQEEEAWEREQQELQKLQGKPAGEDASDRSENASQDKPGEDIDPVMQQYMAMVQQQKTEGGAKTPLRDTVQTSEKTGSQADDISLTDEVKTDTGNVSADDFDW